MFENVVSLEKVFSLRAILSDSDRKNRTRGPDKQYLEGLKIPDRSQQVAKSYPDSAGNVFCSRPRYGTPSFPRKYALKMMESQTKIAEKTPRSAKIRIGLFLAIAFLFFPVGFSGV